MFLDRHICGCRFLVLFRTMTTRQLRPQPCKVVTKADIANKLRSKASTKARSHFPNLLPRQKVVGGHAHAVRHHYNPSSSSMVHNLLRKIGTAADPSSGAINSELDDFAKKMFFQDIKVPKITAQEVHQFENQIVNLSPGTQPSVQSTPVPAAAAAAAEPVVASVPVLASAPAGSSSKTFKDGMRIVGENHKQIENHNTAKKKKLVQDYILAHKEIKFKKEDSDETIDFPIVFTDKSGEDNDEIPFRGLGKDGKLDAKHFALNSDYLYDTNGYEKYNKVIHYIY